MCFRRNGEFSFASEKLRRIFTPKRISYSKMSKEFGPPVVMGNEEIMSKKAHGTTEQPVQSNLRWKVDQKVAKKICCFNRHYAEYSGYFMKTKWLKDVKNSKVATKYFDSVTGKLLFTAPINRTFEAFLAESKAHGWPSFRDDEVNWDIVRVLPDGETVSIDGTHLGHNLPDSKGNRYCINLVCVAGNPVVTETENSTKEMEVFELKKDNSGCTGLFYRSNPTKGRVKTLSKYRDWPRDNAHIKGFVHEVKGKKWLEVKELKQPGINWFESCKGKDVWIPFRHQQYFLEKVEV